MDAVKIIKLSSFKTEEEVDAFLDMGTRTIACDVCGTGRMHVWEHQPDAEGRYIYFQCPDCKNIVALEHDI